MDLVWNRIEAEQIRIKSYEYDKNGNIIKVTERLYNIFTSLN
jgi:hypothetical protein